MPYLPSTDGTGINKPIGATNGPDGARSYFHDTVNFTYRAFVNKQEALDYIDTAAKRKGHFPVVINTGGSLASGVITGGTNVEWWWKDNYTNEGLVPKTTAGGRTYTFVLAQGGSIATGSNVTNQLTIERDGVIANAFINAKTGPVGADLITDINLNGNSIWNTTQANRLKIVAGAVSGSQSTFDTTVVTAGQVLSIDVDQVGSTTPGSSITVQLVTT